MSNLHMIRVTTGIDTCWQYEDKTGVLVLGDIAGYQYLQSRLQGACESDRNIHLDLIEPCRTSMQCVILRPASYPPKKPRIRLFERIIFQHDEPEMELIICGNRPAYERLVENIEWLISKGTDDLDQHIHVDDLNPDWVLKSSVALIIRGPLSRWDVDKVESYYGKLLTAREPTYMPKIAERITKDSKDLYPYQEPVTGEYPFVLSSPV